MIWARAITVYLVKWIVPSASEAREFANATERYARLAKELVMHRKTGPYTDYEKKLKEVDAARERCEKARNALQAAALKRKAANLK